MKEALHRIIGQKLAEAGDRAPDFSHEDWLKLDERLTAHERRRRRFVALIWALPLLLLLGFNAWLGWRLLHHEHERSGSTTSSLAAPPDTVYLTRTVYRTDTVYLPGRVVVQGLPRIGAFATGAAASLHTEGGADGGLLGTKGQLPGSMAASGSSVMSEKVEQSPEQAQGPSSLTWLENSALTPLSWPQRPWYLLHRELPFPAEPSRRVRFPSHSRLSLASGPIYAWYGGEFCEDGFGASLGHELWFSERWSWWQSFSFDRIEMDSKKKFIPDYPKLPFPAPNTKLEWTEVKRRELGFHTGIACAIAPLEHVHLRALLGLGTQYRLGGTYHAEFEDEDTEVYYPVVLDIGAGWAGMHGMMGMGIQWSPLRRWQVGIEAGYHRHLGGGVEDYPVASWLKLEGQVIWRIR